MQCNRCYHRVANIEAKQRKDAYIPQPRCECGADMSVRGCYMYKPPSLLRFTRAKGDKRPVGGPTFIAARIVAADTIPDSDTGVFMAPYGPKRLKQFTFIRRLLTKDEKKELQRKEREYAKFIQGLRKKAKRDGC